MAPGVIAVAVMTFAFGQAATGFVVTLDRGRGLTARGDGSTTRQQRVRHTGPVRRRLTATQNKNDPSATQPTPTIIHGNSQKPDAGDPAEVVNDNKLFFDELLHSCTEATSSDGATESVHTGSSEWAGFRTKPDLLESVTRTLERARQRSRHSDGSAMAWSWLTLSPRPIRVTLASGNPRFGVYLTVLPAGKGNPPSHRPMYGCHMLSRVLAGEIQQVKSNSQRVIGRSTHSLETPVWSSYGGGARRLVNEGFHPAVVLEIVMYDSSRGLGYSGSYAAPGTSSSGSAEHRAEAEEIGAAAAAVSKDTGAGEDATTGAVPVVAMDLCPCPPAALFRDGDAYEEEDNDEGGDGTRLALVRRDGKALAAPGAGGQRNGANASGLAGGSGFSELFTADDLASDVGGLDRQLEDIVRRVLSTRSLPAELRQALGVSHVRGLLLYGPPGCGKTLLARELSRRLGARPPKLVSGPEILDKWIGEAERKVRLLFLDAELEHQRCVQMGEDPAGLPLNLVCFDEIDALCRSRGSLSGDTSGVRDSVVNQILSKMDGLVNLQNVLVVGMTNRKELLDEALLRPGRMEVCMPIPLPDEQGREQIIKIHLQKARDAGLVSPEVDDASLAQQTQGFSGADLAGLVRSAISFAIADWRQRVNGEGPRGKASGGDSSLALEEATNYGTPFASLASGERRIVNGDRRTATDSKEDFAGNDWEEDAGKGLVVTRHNFDKAFLEVGLGRKRGLGARGRLVKWGRKLSGGMLGDRSRD